MPQGWVGCLMILSCWLSMEARSMRVFQRLLLVGCAHYAGPVVGEKILLFMTFHARSPPKVASTKHIVVIYVGTSW